MQCEVNIFEEAGVSNLESPNTSGYKILDPMAYSEQRTFSSFRGLNTYDLDTTITMTVRCGQRTGHIGL